VQARNLYVLAETLGKMVWEIKQMPYPEFVGWQAHFRLSEREKKR